LKSKLVATPPIGFWNENTRSIVPPEAATARSEGEPDHEEIFFVVLLSEPFQMSLLSALISVKVSVLVMLTLVSVITEPVLLVMVVNSCLPGGPETVMALFVMERQAGVGVFVGVLVGVFVGVLVGVFVGVLVAVFVGVLVGVFVGVLVAVFVGVLVRVFVGVLVRVFVGVNV
jgi:hypothetical protein